MQKLWQEYKWIPNTVLGSAIFAAGDQGTQCRFPGSHGQISRG